MVTRVLKSHADVEPLGRLIWARNKYPVTVTITQGDKRSSQQNALAFKWFGEIAQQLGDRTASDVRAYCKLHFGVKLLREENEGFRDTWDRLIRDRFTYEEKLELMVDPHDYPVTRIMTTKQGTKFLDEVAAFAALHGVRLTIPEDK